MQSRLLAIGIALGIGCSAAGAAVTNGDFETAGGSLSSWVSTVFPAAGADKPPDPIVASDAGTGIEGPGGPGDHYAVLDTTTDDGNAVGTDIWSQISQLVGGFGDLKFRLTDVGDDPPPVISNNHSAMLIDNVTVVGDTLSFNWYALTKQDNVDKRNDVFEAIVDEEVLFSFFYNDDLLPTDEENGGGGNVFGPFSYGTGWQTVVIIRETAIPEPGTLALLGVGLLAVARRRRRR